MNRQTADRLWIAKATAALRLAGNTARRPHPSPACVRLPALAILARRQQEKRG